MCLGIHDARIASLMGTVRMLTNQIGADTESAKLKSPLSILHLEDDPNDAALIQSAFETEQLRLEAQVLESQRLELISQLSSGVAHDFNNLRSRCSLAKAKAIRSVP